MPPKPRENPYGVTESGDRLFWARRKLLGVSQGKLGERSGLGRNQIINLESGGNHGSSFDVRNKLADAFGVPEPVFSEYFDGRLPFEEFEKARNSPTGGDDITGARLKRRAEELSLHPSILQALVGERPDGMHELPDEMRRAAWGVVHVSGYPIEQTLLALAKARAKQSPLVKLTAEIWFGLIKGELPKSADSGTHPASGSKIEVAR